MREKKTAFDGLQFVKILHLVFVSNTNDQSNIIFVTVCLDCNSHVADKKNKSLKARILLKQMYGKWIILLILFKMPQH